MMSLKSAIVQVYSYLASDPTILSLMGLTGATPQQVDARIYKTKQMGSVADQFVKIGIWEDRGRPLNPKVLRHTLTIDILAPLTLEASKGVALDLAERAHILLDRKPIGMGLKYNTTNPDAQTTFGWYKASVVFYYNSINS